MEKVLLGVCVGDALGAPLEFIRGLPTNDQIVRALEMKGGGIIGVAPGQVTDDSELMLCLYKSIIEQTDALALYKRWMHSKPIDIGNTCRRAFMGFEPTGDSLSNGALMRCAPIGAVYSKEPDEFIAHLAFKDARLTHAHPTVHMACAAYCIAIAHAMNGRDGHAKALEWVRFRNGSHDVYSWLMDAMESDLDVVCTKHIGHIQWGFTLAFWHLYHETPFIDAMVDVMSRGGDTDTNCAIVGGLVATKQQIPQEMIDAVLRSESGRPTWLHPAKYLCVVDST